MTRISVTAMFITGWFIAAASAEMTSYTIDIGEGIDQLYIGDHWYQPEGPYPQFGLIWHNTKGRWSAQGATVHVPLFKDQVNTITLRAEVKMNPQDHMFVYLNDQKIATLELRDDLLYSFQVQPADIPESGWATLKFENTYQGNANPNDGRDLRAAVDWIRISADQSTERNFILEAFQRKGIQIATDQIDQAPQKWRMRYDPNDIGDKFIIHRFDQLDHDDSGWPIVETDEVPPLRRGESCWYRAWIRIEDKLDKVKADLKLPGNGFEKDGRRTVWVNAARIDTAQCDDLKAWAGGNLLPGYNLIMVKVTQGPLPRPTGDDLVEAPHMSGQWGPEAVVGQLDKLVLTDAFTGTKSLKVSLRNPAGKEINHWQGPVDDLDNGRRGLRLNADWPFDTYGEYTLIVEDDAGHKQQYPVHYLGLHLFHWGWYTSSSGWRGFQPTSNDYLDQLFEHLDDRGRPHHSISWGGAILAPGTGLHLVEKVDYIEKFRQAIADGKLEFAGMPFPPRNIDTDFGESLLRSIRISKDIYNQVLDTNPHVFSSHDSTMTPLLPQFMRLAGYDTYVIAENWWGQEQSVPNSRDCYLRNPDGTQVRVLDSWYHGIPPTVAARRAVELGKPAVLCNEEFACLDRTVFLTQADLDELAGEAIFLQPISLEEYIRVTDDFAKQVVHESDANLCYKGWTGGGPGEVEFEKANRLLENHLVALENVAALARSLGIEVDQKSIDEWWDKSLRWHECHMHWVNGYPEPTGRMQEGTQWAIAEMQRLGELITQNIKREQAGIAVFNPLGFARSGLVRLPAPEKARSLIGPDGECIAIQADPEHEGQALAVLPDLPSCGYRTYAFSEQESAADKVQVDPSPSGVRMDNGQLLMQIDIDGRILAIIDRQSKTTWNGTINKLYFARPKDKIPGEPLSNTEKPLNLNYYGRLIPAQPPKLITRGPALAAVEFQTRPADYRNVTVTQRISLAAGERQIRVRTTLDFPEPTVIAPPQERGPHEGTYLPGIFVAFPYPANTLPMADMAYCVTDQVLSSTNQSTFLNVPFRNGTFNALSMAGPNNHDYAILTRGLHDFFVVDKPNPMLGLSLGVATEGFPYHGQYIHEYAIYMPDKNSDTPAAGTFKAARALLVEPAVIAAEAGEGNLPAEYSFVQADGQSVLIPGVQLAGNELRFRVVNLSDKPVGTQINSMTDLSEAAINPAGQLKNGRLDLGSRAVREVQTRVRQ